MAETEVRVVLADAVVVGPQDRLIIQISDENDDWGEGAIESLLDHLKGMGLEDRTLVFFGNAEFVKVTKE